MSDITEELQVSINKVNSVVETCLLLESFVITKFERARVALVVASITTSSISL